MTIGEHRTEFAGRPVEEFDRETGIGAADHAWRLRVDYEAAEQGQTFAGLMAAFLANPRAAQVPALVVGCWEGAWEGTSSADVVEALVSARDRLTALRALFLGDIVCEESEISWINQSDVSPLLEAYANLEEFGVRGGNGLSLGRMDHEHLRTLVIETGGLSGSVVREVAAARLPRLEHLELWLGDPGYGNDVTTEDLEPILSGRLFPHLRSLGLRDAAQADAIAELLARSPLLERIRVLDLSLGTLSDAGAEALRQCPAVARLERLDLHHHYLSDTMMNRLRALGPDVNLDERKDPDEWGGESHRYVAVAE